jgi:hypothetical protein
MGKEDLMEQLIRKPLPVEDMPLKKKQSTGGGGGNINFTLTEPDDINDPHMYNDLIHDDATQALQQIDTYDITRHPPIDVEYWKSKAEKKQEEKTGLDYWVGYEEDELPGDERKIKEVIYFGDKESEKIEKVFSGYVGDPAGGYAPKFRTEYEYNGDAISRMLKYLIWNTEVLIEESIFEGDKDNNKIVQRIIYSPEEKYADGSPKVISRQDFWYGEGTTSDITEPLRQMREYDTSKVDPTIEDPKGEGVGRLKSVTYFVGEKDKEVADYTLNVEEGAVIRDDGTIDTTDGAITSTIINYYRGGNRAKDADNRDPKERVVSYKGEVDPNADTDGDGFLIGVRDNVPYRNLVSSVSYYDSVHRLPGEEVLNYTENYHRGNIFQTTVHYYGEGEIRATAANYRAPMRKSVSYFGDALNDDGSIMTDAREKTTTYFYIEGRLKGEETSDYSISKNSNGDIVSTTVYYYEGNKRAAESDVTDLMTMTVMYRRSIGDIQADTIPTLDTDGDTILVLDGYTSQLAGITYYDYLGREKGKELTDYSVKYNRRLQRTSTTIFLYEPVLNETDLRRAKDAESSSRVDRTVTYRRGVDVTAGLVEDDLLDGYKSQLSSKTYNHYDGRERNEEIADYTRTYNSFGTVANTSVYYYYDTVNKQLNRANLADTYDPTAQTNTYRGDTQGSGPIKQFADQLKSITYNSLIYKSYSRFKGEEVSDYTANYSSADDGDVITISVFFYGNNDRRADQSGSNDTTSRIHTYRGKVSDVVAKNGLSSLSELARTNLENIRSITYNDITGRLKGEEIADYTHNYSSRKLITSTSVYYYDSMGILKRAVQAESDDLTSQINTYRGDNGRQANSSPTQQAGDNLRSIAYNNLEYDDGTGVPVDRIKGEEVADYSESYNSKGRVTSVNIYFYGADNKRSLLANSDIPTSKVSTYRGKVTDIVNANKAVRGAIDDIGDILFSDRKNIRSITYNHIDQRLKGEEVADYTYNFNSAGTITSKNIYFYGLGVRAEDATSEDVTLQINTYRGTRDVNTVLSMDDTGPGSLIISITRNNVQDSLGVDRLKGEEVADYTYNYNSQGVPSTKSAYFYGTTDANAVRAKDADSEDTTLQINTYRGARDINDPVTGVELISDTGAGSLIRSTTRNNVQNSSGIDRYKGEEVADYTYNYNSKGEAASKIVYFYGTTEADAVRAPDADSEDTTLQINTYRGARDITTVVNIDDTAAGSLIRSITRNNIRDAFGVDRLKGEEIADYTYNYSSKGDPVTKTVYFYGTTNIDAVRAKYAGSEDTTLQINTYRGARDINDPTTGVKLINDTEAGSLIRSITRNYVTSRLKGEEVADYTYNYNSQGVPVTKSVYFYGTTNVIGRYNSPDKHLPGREGYYNSDKHRRHRPWQSHKKHHS